MKQQEIIDDMREHCTNLAMCEKFSNVCNELAERINHRLFEDSREFHWILDIPGGLCDFEDTDLLTPDEMVLILGTTCPTNSTLNGGKPTSPTSPPSTSAHGSWDSVTKC